MSQKTLGALLTIAVALSACNTSSQSLPQTQTTAAPPVSSPLPATPQFGTAASSAKPSVTVYKSPTCGCCSNWVEHMRTNGFDVKALDVDDVDLVKRSYGVPRSVDSCHTALVEGYVVEGHVPADAVMRLLRERPKVAGIAVGGMPMGSPGMEVPGQKDPYVIASFDKAGQTAVYDRR